jgi:hypothetical protein
MSTIINLCDITPPPMVSTLKKKIKFVVKVEEKEEEKEEEEEGHYIVYGEWKIYDDNGVCGTKNDEFTEFESKELALVEYNKMIKENEDENDYDLIYLDYIDEEEEQDNVECWEKGVQELGGVYGLGHHYQEEEDTGFGTEYHDGSGFDDCDSENTGRRTCKEIADKSKWCSECIYLNNQEEEEYEKCEKCDIRLGNYDGKYEMKVDWFNQVLCGKCSLTCVPTVLGRPI